MPIVQVSVWEGISPENKKKAVEGITKVFEDLGFPRKRWKRQRAIGQRVDNCIQKNTRTRNPCLNKISPFDICKVENSVEQRLLGKIQKR